MGDAGKTGEGAGEEAKGVYLRGEEHTEATLEGRQSKEMAEIATKDEAGNQDILRLEKDLKALKIHAVSYRYKSRHTLIYMCRTVGDIERL